MVPSLKAVKKSSISDRSHDSDQHKEKNELSLNVGGGPLVPNLNIAET